MHTQLLQLASVGEIPDDDICLKALEGLLSGGDVLTRLRALDSGDLVIVTFKEGLGAGDYMTDDNGGAQREEKMFVIWVKDETFGDLA